MTIKICAKCSDLFNAVLIDGGGSPKGKLYDGYVPEFMPGDHYGDYVQLHIDLETGQIINWKRPTLKQLEITFGKLS